MILIIGASGRLGGAVARRLLASGTPVRALSRTPQALTALEQAGAEVVFGDLRDSRTLAPALQGADAVLYAAHAFNSSRKNTSRQVDDSGVRQLIEAAKLAKTQRFVFTSIHGARPEHPVDVFRYKYAAEQALRASGLSYTILRPTAFMELWLTIMSEPMRKKGQALIFGRGVNPINFVSVEDVARFAVIGLEDPHARGLTIEVGGPENLSLTQVVATIERVMGQTYNKRHIPLPIMRAMALLTRPFFPFFSRQTTSAVVMDTTDMTLDPTPTLALFPGELSRMEDVARHQLRTVAANRVGV